MQPITTIVKGIAVDPRGTRRHEQGVMLSSHPEVLGWQRLEISVVDAARQLPKDSEFDDIFRRRTMECRLHDMAERNLHVPDLPVETFKVGKAVPAITLTLDIDGAGAIQSHDLTFTHFELIKPVTFDEFNRLHRTADPAIREWVKTFDQLQSAFITQGDRRSPADTLARRVSSLINHYAGVAMHEAGVPALFFAPREIAACADDFRVVPKALGTDYAEGFRRRQLYVLDSTDKEPGKRYARISGPGRNYFDLVNQRALTAVMLGLDAPYNEADMIRFCAAGNEQMIFQSHHNLLSDWVQANPNAIPHDPEERVTQIEDGLNGATYHHAPYVAGFGQNAHVLTDERILSALFSAANREKPLQELLALQLIEHVRTHETQLEGLIQRLPEWHDSIAQVEWSLTRWGEAHRVELILLDADGGILESRSEIDATIGKALIRLCDKQLQSLLFNGPADETTAPEERELLLTPAMEIRIA